MKENTALMASAPIDPIQQHLVTIENMKKLIALKRKGHLLSRQHHG